MDYPIICSLSVLVQIITLAFAVDQNNVPHYKMCVPKKIYESCKELMDAPSEIATIECVPARDRMDCLDRVNRREVDFLAVDPEDMYVAHHTANEDFTVFSELRTALEAEAEFRYEGIILVHRNSDIRSLADLKGKKSCHTGFGRNVGYKIPITKLKKNGVLKVSMNPALSPVEVELKALSELFSSSCLVGTYSANVKVNSLLKKRYSNLCELCADPVKCDYPDKYSGYDGAIRCLVENGGDVAFTKVIYVRRFFGLPIGNNPAKTHAEANPDDYEYLCEDGSRKPVTGPACSWAQRPWQGYMGNADLNIRLTRLQDRLQIFYDNGKLSSNRKAAKDMWISDDNVIVKKMKQVSPGEHLTRAQYKDVIERDGSVQQKIRLCVSDEISLKKCDTMKRAAYARDIRPEFECNLSTDCLTNVMNNNSDVAVVPIVDYKKASDDYNLHLLFYEKIDPNSSYVALCDKNCEQTLPSKIGISFDQNDPRIVDAALNFNFNRKVATCPDTLASDNDSPIKIVKFSDDNQYADKILICPDGSHKPITESKTCNFNAKFGRSIFVSKTILKSELENILHAFTSVSNNFGRNGKLEDVFLLFGEFQLNQPNVLFTDDATEMINEKDDKAPELDRSLYYRLHCL